MTLWDCINLENSFENLLAFLKNLLHEICFVDMGSDIIPEEEDERGDLYDDVDHPLPISSPAGSQPSDEIYEELPGIYYLVIHLRIVGLFFFFFF